MPRCFPFETEITEITVVNTHTQLVHLFLHPDTVFACSFGVHTSLGGSEQLRLAGWEGFEHHQKQVMSSMSGFGLELLGPPDTSWEAEPASSPGSLAYGEKSGRKLQRDRAGNVCFVFGWS